MNPLLRPGALAVAPAPRLSHAFAAVALALLLGLQPISTDVYLPALPLLTRSLHATMSGAQLTMAALILAFGVGQLFWGPVADRTGRRPVLLAGLALYTAASVGAALAPDIGTLVTWRALQGASLAAAVVVARAIVRDLYEPHEGAQVMALALSGLALIAACGPALGGQIAAAFGWRAVLGGVATVGAAALAFVAGWLPETLHHRNPHATRLAPLLATWAQILRQRDFVAWTLLISCTYGGLFTVLAGSSFVYMNMLGLSPGTYGLVMASASLSYLLGTLACRRWILRHGARGAVRRGAGFTLAGGTLMVAFAVAGVHAVWAVLLPQWLYCFGHGIHQPCGQAGAVGPFARSAGAASALAGFVLALTAFAIGSWLGQVLDASVLPFALGVGFWALATSLVGWTLVQRL